MKKLYNYNNFINEGIKDYLKPKSEEQILIELGDASPDRKLRLGCQKNLRWLVEKGLEEGGNPAAGENRLIIWASENGHIDLVKKLLKDERVDPSGRQNEAITEASRNGHIEIVKLLLDDDRVDPSDFNSFSLIYACENGHIEIVKLLLDDGRVDQFSLGNLSRNVSKSNKHDDIVKLLDEYEENYNKKVYKNK